MVLDDVGVLQCTSASVPEFLSRETPYIQVFQEINLQLQSTLSVDGLGIPESNGLTIITRNSLLGKSVSLICLTATVSPVFQFNALYTDPNAPLPKQSPNCFTISTH